MYIGSVDIIYILNNAIKDNRLGNHNMQQKPIIAVPKQMKQHALSNTTYSLVATQW